MDESRNMNDSHLNEEQMILHFYEGDSAGHLAECGECQTRFAALRALLNTVGSIQVPERDADYGARVWAGLQGRLRNVPRRSRVAAW